MTIPVYFWSPDPNCPNRGYWATTLIEDMVAGKVWQPSSRFELSVHEGKPPTTVQGCVLVVPGRFESDERFNEVQSVLDNLDWCLFIYVSDEEQLSRWWDLKHDNIKFWIQAPFVKDSDKSHFIPFGYTPHTRKTIAEYGFIEKPKFDWSFLGQNTHKRRYELVSHLEQVPNGLLEPSKQFAGGYEPEEYIQTLCETLVAPAPGGPVHVDSFRLYEALECGCVPVADTYAGNNSGYGLWDEMFGVYTNERPFYVSSTWAHIGDVIKANATSFALGQSWGPYFGARWLQYKREEVIRLHETIKNLSGCDYDKTDDISFIITTSPIISHPSTEIIEETVNSIRFWHPTAEIIITCDGLREEQSEWAVNYQTYLRKLNYLCNHVWFNVVPVMSREFMHQVRTTYSALEFVQTDVVCFVEHDTPIVMDEPIEWEPLIQIVKNNQYEVIRLYHEGVIPKEHANLYPHPNPTEIYGVKVLRTFQWSNRPHIARKDYYQKVLTTYFSPDCKTFTEDKMHSVAQQYTTKHRIALYWPGDGSNLKRSLHTDGRAGEKKYDDRLVF